MCKVALSELKDLLHYNAKTGVFTWKKPRPGGVKPGDESGRVDSRGYSQVCVRGKRYLAHRLAWFYQTGCWPAHEIDHIDRDRLNNRFANLREATRPQNMRNKSLYKNNTSGVAGVRRASSGRSWVAYDGDNYLGAFRSKADAVSARMEAF